MASGSTHSLTNEYRQSFLGKEQPERNADNFNVICELIV
jgi:hypothetical protein